MTYGRCTIGMVPTATVLTYEVWLSCLVLLYDSTYLELYDCTYVLEYRTVVRLTLLSVRLSCMTLYWYLCTTPYVVFILPTTLFIIAVWLPLLYGTYLHIVGYYLDYGYTMTVMSHAGTRYNCLLRTTVWYCTNDSPVPLDGLLSCTGTVCRLRTTPSSLSCTVPGTVPGTYGTRVRYES
jgi:hypothetical protein